VSPIRSSAKDVANSSRRRCAALPMMCDLRRHRHIRVSVRSAPSSAITTRSPVAALSETVSSGTMAAPTPVLPRQSGPAAQRDGRGGRWPERGCAVRRRSRYRDGLGTVRIRRNRHYPASAPVPPAARQRLQVDLHVRILSRAMSRTRGIRICSTSVCETWIRTDPRFSASTDRRCRWPSAPSARSSGGPPRSQKARVGQAHPARVALEQGKAKVMFQLGNLAAEDEDVRFTIRAAARVEPCSAIRTT
jgi:hypothetical protein